jgi:hypothetical protein
MSKGTRSLKEMLDATAAGPLESRVIKATDSVVDVPKAKHMEGTLPTAQPPRLLFVVVHFAISQLLSGDVLF